MDLDKLTYSSPVRVSKVAISGSQRIKNCYFDAQLADVVSKARDVNGLIRELQKAEATLNQSGLFELVESSISVDSNSRSNNNNYTPMAISMTVKEKGVPSLRMESNVQSGVGKGSSVNGIGAELEASLRSPLGRYIVTAICIVCNVM